MKQLSKAPSAVDMLRIQLEISRWFDSRPGFPKTLFLHVCVHEPTTLTKALKSLGIARSTGSRQFSQLRDAGLVTEKVDNLDRRSMKVYLAEDGQALRDDLLNLLIAREGDF